jgi:hypothetical protein
VSPTGAIEARRLIMSFRSNHRMFHHGDRRRYGIAWLMTAAQTQHTACADRASGWNR